MKSPAIPPELTPPATKQLLPLQAPATELQVQCERVMGKLLSVTGLNQTLSLVISRSVSNDTFVKIAAAQVIGKGGVIEKVAMENVLEGRSWLDKIELVLDQIKQQ
jgi:ABC-type cobalamin transport system ATPase subunit